MACEVCGLLNEREGDPLAPFFNNQHGYYCHDHQACVMRALAAKRLTRVLGIPADLVDGVVSRLAGNRDRSNSAFARFAYGVAADVPPQPAPTRRKRRKPRKAKP